MPLRSPENQRRGYNISVVAEFGQPDTETIILDGATELIPMAVKIYSIGVFTVNLFLTGDYTTGNNSTPALEIEVLVDGNVVETVEFYQTRASSGTWTYNKVWWINEEDFDVETWGPGPYTVEVQVTDIGDQSITTVKTLSELQAVGPFR